MSAIIDLLDGNLSFQWYVYFFLLTFFNGAWYMTYFLVIRRGFIEKTFGVPMVALALNFSWDIAGAFILQSPVFQHIANIIFFISNAIITFQLLRYWRSDYGGYLKRNEFYVWWAFIQVMAMAFIFVGSDALNDPQIYTVGFVDNFINSALFIAMFYRREGLLGQSIYIALSKWIGTGCMILAAIWLPWPGTEDSVLLWYTYVGITVLDIVYIYLVWRRGREMGIDIWKRW